MYQTIYFQAGSAVLRSLFDRSESRPVFSTLASDIIYKEVSHVPWHTR